MKLLSRVLFILLLALSTLASAAEGLIALKSPHSAADTMDKFEASSVRLN
ncbi:hypothetical protein UT5_20740 [Ferrigenium sp. UT5]